MTVDMLTGFFDEADAGCRRALSLTVSIRSRFLRLFAELARDKAIDCLGILREAFLFAATEPFLDLTKY